MKRWTVGFTVLVVLVGVRESQAEWSFMGLGSLGGVTHQSYASAVSADGSVVVGVSRNSWDLDEAFRWENGNMVGLGTLGGPHSQATAVSADGSVIVGLSKPSSTSDYEMFRWEEGNMVGLGTFGKTTSHAHDVSADGSVIVGYIQGEGYGFVNGHAIRWENGQVVSLGTLGGWNAWANAVSADGSVVVGRSETSRTSPEGNEAFRWENGNMIGLGTLGGDYSSADAISADGSVIWGSSSNASGNSQTFRWENGNMVGLGTIRGSWSTAKGFSGDGSVIVGYSGIGSSGGAEAFIYVSGQMRSLQEMLVEHGVDLSGWELFGAHAISDDGNVIVGWGHNPMGQTEAWIATIPEPSTLVLLSIGALVLTVACWRRRRKA